MGAGSVTRRSNSSMTSDTCAFCAGSPSWSREPRRGTDQVRTKARHVMSNFKGPRSSREGELPRPAIVLAAVGALQPRRSTECALVSSTGLCRDLMAGGRARGREEAAGCGVYQGGGPAASPSREDRAECKQPWQKTESVDARPRS